MAWQFPANPIVGDIFTPVVGTSFRWNGTGWAPYSTSLVTRAEADALYIPQTEKAAALGVASLDAGGQVPLAQMPDLSATYIAVTEKGAANGVASLDSGTKVPTAQIPDLSATYIAVTTKGVANGVASLDSSGKVPSTQLPASSGGGGGGLTRQCVVTGSVDGSGNPNALSAGSGLALNLAATTTPILLAFAGGYSASGASDHLSP